ncbi:MAG: zf-TFIIB domain-containing protein [Candidatus Sulfobium sp.]
MNCPRDEQQLEPATYEGHITVHTCPGCGGMWLPKGELEEIEEIAGHDYTGELSRIPDVIGNAYEMARQLNARGFPCPSCGAVTESTEYAYCSQVVIDKCPECGGIWLDKGELEAIEIFYERSRKESRGLRLSFLKGLVHE